MARSTYAYVVMCPGVTQPLAAFTVKHELRSWLDRVQAGPLGTVIPERLEALKAYRMPDGGGEGTEMSIPGILAGK